LRILLINYRYFISGGPERYMFNVKDLLEQAGHEVIPFSIKSRSNITTKYEHYFAEPLGGQDEAYFSKARHTPKFMWDVLARLFYSFHVKKRLKRLIDDTQPDVAYILHHYNKLSPSVISACKNNGVRIVMRLSDYFLFCPQAHFLRNGIICEDCLQKTLLSCVRYKCIKNSRIGSLLKAMALYFHKNILEIYDNVDMFVCTTEFMKKKLLQDGIESNRISVITTYAKDYNLKKEDDTESDYILYFGRFSYEKGVDILINAYFKSGLPELSIKLVLVGGKLSDLRGVEPDLLDKIGDNIIIYDFLTSDKLNPLIKACLYTIVPSRWYENLPNTIVESYKFNKPVIASDIGCLPEVVHSNITGLLFKLENVDDLSQKLKYLVINKKFRESLKKNIRETNLFLPNVHYEKLIKILK